MRPASLVPSRGVSACPSQLSRITSKTGTIHATTLASPCVPEKSWQQPCVTSVAPCRALSVGANTCKRERVVAGWAGQFSVGLYLRKSPPPFLMERLRSYPCTQSRAEEPESSAAIRLLGG